MKTVTLSVRTLVVAIVATAIVTATVTWKASELTVAQRNKALIKQWDEAIRQINTLNRQPYQGQQLMKIPLPVINPDTSKPNKVSVKGAFTSERKIE